ncbi:putative DNA methyltransferase YeeA [Lactococcus hodotermopsidis]|uniref:site-specific DNA-methyltransferase (adenine-specific) n=1 Tax=Pseudolactococcus hodotermopsidis TaxID=2709157 RepID=A0A6A0BD60_9LACT|nr:DNA methyltransferase [Lactococcus hodotermopsidis]GFH42288.1 putative DNA methyltransferase YeeA [Lactococcus hodotermopsidis]
MVRRPITEIENGLQELFEKEIVIPGEFIYNFLAWYDIPKSTLTRAKNEKEINLKIKNKIHYELVKNGATPVSVVTKIEQEIKGNRSQPRFIIATNIVDFAAKDTKTQNTLTIPLIELPAKADFFLPLNGIEKVEYEKENPADRKAADRFTKLYDTLIKINEEATEKDFNEFLIRLLFLLFAEDTNIMPKSIFTNAIKTRTAVDGSDMNGIISDIFKSLDVLTRNSEKEWLRAFPYVNGKLFSKAHVNLKFNAVTRKMILEAGELLDWNEINPDILGSMIQTVANAEQRAVTGMHYTSVENIKKLIKPLFLDDLTMIYDEIAVKISENEDKEITEKSKQENRRTYEEKLEALIERISKIKFFDPACGSGNFLIITYKEIRRLEINILKTLGDLRIKKKEEHAKQGNMLKTSAISLNKFYGIELDDFAHEVARLSLWIAEHQMNVEMTETLADYQPNLLPLKDAGHIIQGNSLRIDWNEAVPHTADEELYIMGNPPYIGARKMDSNQKREIAKVFESYLLKTGDLDYISGWFMKIAISVENTNIKAAIVSTNSVVQGSQASLLWNTIFNKTEAEINFAYSSFKWGNSAKHNAGVTVVIVGIVNNKYKGNKVLFDTIGGKIVKQINAYLVDGPLITVKKSTSQISNLPEMLSGDMPNDGGNLIADRIDEFVDIFESKKYSSIIKEFIGSREFLNDKKRYTLWISENDLELAISNTKIKNRIDRVRKLRENSSRKVTREMSDTPYRFGEIRHKNFDYIFIPQVSSENRDYVPMGILDKNVITASPNFAIYDAPIWLLGLLESRMHMTWLRAVGGKLKTDYRYSAGLVYNTFPVPELSTQRKNQMENQIFEILDLREEIGGTLAELYNNKTMPKRLREAHEALDRIVERAYRRDTPFVSDEERLSVLLNMYQEMTKDD